MFFAEDKILAVRQMILADSVEERRRALDKILPMQREDFVGIFRAMDGLPVTIRLLDPPLHEFLPTEDGADRAWWRDELRVTARRGARARRRAARVQPDARPPRLPPGHHQSRRSTRCRCARSSRRRCEVKRAGVDVKPEIMIPLVGHERELAHHARARGRRPPTRRWPSANEKIALHRRHHDRAAARLHGGRQASPPTADFFSLRHQRPDADDARRLARRRRAASSATTSSAASIRRSVRRHRSGGLGAADPHRRREGPPAQADLKIGICGEHGGEPSSVEFCHGLGFDYVSCSPFRVPIARLAAAQAALRAR